jgi:isoleucyl-tRNA synthetase
LNVKRVRFSDNEDTVVTLSVKPNFRNLGKRFGPEMKEAAKIIETFTLRDIVMLEKGETIEVKGAAIGLADIEIRRTKHEGVVVETQDEMIVALNTEITTELEDECAAREFVNRVQNFRKKRDFKLTDRIVVRCICPQPLQESLRRFAVYICNETLATSIEWCLDPKAGSVEKVDINGAPAEVQVSVLG